MSSLIVMLDGFRYDYLNRTSFLREIGRKGFCTRLETLLGYSSGIHASIWTGATQQTIGMWTKYKYGNDSSPSLFKKLFYALPSGFARTIVVKAYQSRIRRDPNLMPGIPAKVANMFEPEGWLDDSMENYVKHFENTLSVPTLFDVFKNNGIRYFYLNIDKTQTAEMQSSATRIHAKNLTTFLMISSLDHLGHRVGPFSPRIDEELKRVDHLLKNIVCNGDFEHVFIFSDHGMTQINKLVNVQKTLKKSGLVLARDYIAFHDATMSRFWINDENVKSRITIALNQNASGRILSDRDLKKYTIEFKGNHRRKFGDLVFLANPGVNIFPNYFHCFFSSLIQGLHGYDPKHPSSYGIFIYNGPFKDRLRNDVTMSVIDIFPTILNILHIPVPPSVEGSSAFRV